MNRHRTRLFTDADLDSAELNLDQKLAHYARNVLRLGVGDEVTVFNGRGTERRGTIARFGRRECILQLTETLPVLPAAPVAITLIQGLIKPDRMDLIVQKATELGVSALVAVKTDFSSVRVDADRQDKKMSHWARVAASACEQSGRHFPPTIAFEHTLDAAVGARPAAEARIAFDNQAEDHEDLPLQVSGSVTLIVGPEGGFSPAEREMLKFLGCRFVLLGPRTLRAETAAIAAATLAQQRWGDMNQPG